MAATEATLRAAIETLMNTVTNIGTVHDYERHSTDWSDLLDKYKTTISSTEQIRGWTTTCERVENRVEANQYHRKTYTFVIRGYLGLDDADETEKTAIALGIAVIEKLEQYPRLNGTLTVGTFTADGWPYIEVFQPRMLGGMLCHYTEIRLQVYEKGAVTYQE